MDLNGDLEARVCCASSREKKGSNARGSDTEDNLAFRAELVAEGLVDECLASASRSMEEEALASIRHDRLDDLGEGVKLLWVESRPLLCDPTCLVLYVIVSLLSNELVVVSILCPAHVRAWHSRIVPLKSPPRLTEDAIEEEETIVEYLVFCGLRDVLGMLKSSLEVVADVNTEVIPEVDGTGGEAVKKERPRS